MYGDILDEKCIEKEEENKIIKDYIEKAGLTGGFLLLRNFSVAVSVSPLICFILVLILISMFLR